MKKWLIPALSALCVLAIWLMIYVLTRQPVRTDDFVPPTFDEAALSGTPDVPGNLGYSPVKVEDAFSAYICGTVILDEIPPMCILQVTAKIPCG